jgi:hypothetical protein
MDFSRLPASQSGGPSGAIQHHSKETTMTLKAIRKTLGTRRFNALVKFAMSEFDMTATEARGMLRDCNKEEFLAHLEACECGYF